MKTIGIFAGLALGATAALASGNGKLMRAGQWEITVTTEMEGLSKLPPQTFSKCFKPEDVKEPKDILKKTSQPDCTQKDLKIDGNKVSWSIECHKNGGTQTGTGEVTYAGEAYEGVTRLQLSDPRLGNRNVVSRSKARRTGECTE